MTRQTPVHDKPAARQRRTTMPAGAKREDAESLRAKAKKWLEKYKEAQEKEGPCGVTDEHLSVQADRVAELVRRLEKPAKATILGDPVGTGKTAVTLAAVGLLLDKVSVRFVLVAAPNDHVRDLWEERAGFLGLPAAKPGKQRARWKEGRVIVATRSKIPARPSPEPAKTLIVVDEAHRGLQHEENDFYKKLEKIAGGARLLHVTATPMQLSGKGLAAMLRFPCPDDPDLTCLPDYGEAIADLIETWRKDPDPKSAVIKKAVDRVRTVGKRALEKLNDHLMPPFPREAFDMPEPPDLPRHPVPAGEWATAYHVARVVPELVDEGKGDMFQRRLVSSCEAFWSGVAGEALTRRCKEGKDPAAAEFRHLLGKRLGDGDAHPKVRETVDWVAKRFAEGRHVLVFCIFQKTQDALAKALEEKEGLKGNVKCRDNPHDIATKKELARFREKPGAKTPLVLVVRDNMSESIDLDGGSPCIVHHDLPWNPMRIAQRLGRVIRISSGFQSVDKEDIFVPFLDVEVERRMFETVQGRKKMVDLFLPAGNEDRENSDGKDSVWQLPDRILNMLPSRAT